MAHFVTKKDGSRVPFDLEKIKASVMAAAADAEMPDEEGDVLATQIAESMEKLFSGQEEVSTTEIKEKIIAELEVSSPVVAEAWRHYEDTKH